MKQRRGYWIYSFYFVKCTTIHSLLFNECVQRYSLPLRVIPSFMFSKIISRSISFLTASIWTEKSGCIRPMDIPQVSPTLAIVLEGFLANQADKSSVNRWHSILHKKCSQHDISLCPVSGLQS